MSKVSDADFGNPVKMFLNTTRMVFLSSVDFDRYILSLEFSQVRKPASAKSKSNAERRYGIYLLRKIAQ